MDRRKRKTQQGITDTFYQLLQKKAYEEISVSQICQLTDINRGTFYLHFIDKDDLLEKSIRHEMDELIHYCEANGGNNNQQKIERTFEYVDHHRERLSKLFKADKQGFFAHVQLEYLSQQLVDVPELTAIFFTHGLMGLLEHYLTCDVSKKEIAEILENITTAFSPSN
ncbi:MAG: TetR/AcrR family transcriptional regulator [Enterococcus sp.]|uniref:TetR/AcrR family transcriptional regulator n=1 Tax=Enterococcus sp. TaxID=35783 RepID=UPI002FC8B014